MELRSRVTPVEVDDERKTRLKQGILNLPLSLMLPFGLLGLRSGQLFNKIAGCVINLMFLFNYGLILAVTIARFMNIKDHDTLNSFLTGFAVVMEIKFTILIYIYFKRFNFVMLLEDITRRRKYSLSKKELLFVITTFIAGVTMATYLILYVCYRFLLPVLRTGGSTFAFAFKLDNTATSGVKRILEFLFFMVSTWISILATAFLINVISIVLRREFDKCIENLREKIKETGILSSEIFSETVDRFQELRGLVEKVDNMFFLDFVLNLGLSLGLLCSSFYGIYVRELTYEDMHIPILVSMLTLLIMLPPSAALRSKVTVSSCYALFVRLIVVLFA